MGVVLLEGAGPHQTVQGTRRLVAVAGAELGITDRQIPPRAQALVEYLNVARTRHRLERHRSAAVLHAEHVLAELLPMAAADPQIERHQSRSLYFGVAEPAHLSSNVVFQHPIDGKAARVPEDHSGSILLDVPEVEPGCEVAVIEIVHLLRSFVRGRSADEIAQKRRAPSVTGGALSGGGGFSLPRATRRRPADGGRRGGGRRGGAKRVHAQKMANGPSDCQPTAGEGDQSPRWRGAENFRRERSAAPGGLVIRAIQLKYLVMPARSLALALLVLLCVTPAGRAAEPAGATVVLQLPPSMSPEAVKGLIADLAAKGAQPPRPLPPIPPRRPLRL